MSEDSIKELLKGMELFLEDNAKDIVNMGEKGFYIESADVVNLMEVWLGGRLKKVEDTDPTQCQAQGPTTDSPKPPFHTTLEPQVYLTKFQQDLTRELLERVLRKIEPIYNQQQEDAIWPIFLKYEGDMNPPKGWKPPSKEECERLMKEFIEPNKVMVEEQRKKGE